MSDTDMLSDAAAVLSNASNTGMGSPHTPAWSQAMQLEKRLKGEARKRSFWDPEVGGVREGTYQVQFDKVAFSLNPRGLKLNSAQALLVLSTHQHHPP